MATGVRHERMPYSLSKRLFTKVKYSKGDIGLYQTLINHILEQKHNLTKLIINYKKNPSEKNPNTLYTDDLTTLSEINKIKDDIASGIVNPKQDWDYDFIPKVKPDSVT